VIPADGETPKVFKEIAANDELYNEAWQVFSEILKKDRIVARQYIKDFNKMLEEVF
jgi:hypothetical protein